MDTQNENGNYTLLKIWRKIMKKVTIEIKLTEFDDSDTWYPINDLIKNEIECHGSDFTEDQHKQLVSDEIHEYVHLALEEYHLFDDNTQSLDDIKVTKVEL